MSTLRRAPGAVWVERVVSLAVWVAVAAGALHGFEPNAPGVVRAVLFALLFGTGALLLVGALSLLRQLLLPRSGRRPPGRAGAWQGLPRITWRRATGTCVGLVLLHALLDVVGGLLGRELLSITVYGATALFLFGLFQLVMRLGKGRRAPD